MSIAEKITTIAGNEQKVYEAGKKAERDNFWDVFQQNGKRQDYNNAFKSTWNDEIFKPKYDIICDSCSAMFQYCKIKNLKEILETQGVTLNFSACTGLLQTFQGAACLHIPVVDARNATNMAYAFGSRAKVVTIDKLILSENSAVSTNTFGAAEALTNIVIEGVLAKTTTFKDSTLLSHDSIVSIINSLSTTTTGTSIGFSLTAVNNAFETSEGLSDGINSDEWKALVASKTNWTISLV